MVLHEESTVTLYSGTALRLEETSSYKTSVKVATLPWLLYSVAEIAQQGSHQNLLPVPSEEAVIMALTTLRPARDAPGMANE